MAFTLLLSPFFRSSLRYALIFDFGTFTVVFFVMPLNAFFATFFVFSLRDLMTSNFSFLHLENAFFPIFVTFFPIMILVTLLFPLKLFRKQMSLGRSLHSLLQMPELLLFLWHFLQVPHTALPDFPNPHSLF